MPNQIVLRITPLCLNMEASEVNERKKKSSAKSNNPACYQIVPFVLPKNIIIESMMVLRPRQGNLRQVFRLFSLMRGSAEHETNNLKTSLRFPCRGLNMLNIIIDYFSHTSS